MAKASWTGLRVVTLCVFASTVGAITLEVTPTRIEAALKIARGPEPGRASYARSSHSKTTSRSPRTAR